MQKALPSDAMGSICVSSVFFLMILLYVESFSRKVRHVCETPGPWQDYQGSLGNYQGNMVVHADFN